MPGEALAMPPEDLTGFQRDLLKIVEKLGVSEGVEVREEINAEYSTDVSHGRLYPNLDSLTEKGLVSKGERDGRTKEYSLTDLGQRTLDGYREWMEADDG